MDYRLNSLDSFARGMLDIQITRNPLAQEVVLIYNDITRDQYQDAIHVESSRVKKQALVKKNVDMNYVQELGGDLLEDSDSIPWIVNLTTTDLSRIPKMDDQILINGIKYTISMVKPANRNLSSLLNLFIYPERTQQEESLSIISLSLVYDGVCSILYTGNPIEMSFDGLEWTSFNSFFKLEVIKGGFADSDTSKLITRAFKDSIEGGFADSDTSKLITRAFKDSIEGGTSLFDYNLYLRNTKELVSTSFDNIVTQYVNL